MLGNHENAKNCVSQHWENQKLLKITFPKVGKTEKQRKQRFPNLGRSKITKNNISQHWESKTII